MRGGMPFFEVSVQPSEINGGKKETGKMLMSRRKRARILRMRMKPVCTFNIGGRGDGGLERREQEAAGHLGMVG